MVTVEGAIVPEWQEWSDAGGDHAYSATVGDSEVLVYGSAPTEDLLTVVRVADRRTGGLSQSSSPRAASSRARAPSSHSWQMVASCSPRSHSASDSSSVVPPASSLRTTSTSSSRACS